MSSIFAISKTTPSIKANKPLPATVAFTTYSLQISGLGNRDSFCSYVHCHIHSIQCQCLILDLDNMIPLVHNMCSHPHRENVHCHSPHHCQLGLATWPRLDLDMNMVGSVNCSLCHWQSYFDSWDLWDFWRDRADFKKFLLISSRLAVDLFEI